MPSEQSYSTLFPWACIALVLFAIWRRNRARYAGVRALPTPDGAETLWGHERAIFTGTPGVAIRRWSQEIGLTFRIKAALGAKDILVLGDPGGITHIMHRRIYDYHHSEVVRPRAARLLGKGVGWVEGEEEHRRLRNQLAPALTRENVKAMSHEVRHGVAQVIDELTAHVATEGDKEPLNMVEWMSKLALNVIGRAAFSFDFEGGNGPEARDILDGRHRGVAMAKRKAAFFLLMLLRRFTFLNKLPIPIIQAQGAARAAIHRGVARELLRRDKDIGAKDSSNHTDLLTLMLDAYKTGELTQQLMYDQVSTYIVAGHETTSQTLAFTLYELSRHPDKQQRLREELDEFVGEPNYDDFNNRLPYLDAVMKEALRLYPALPYMERVATKEDLIPLRYPVKGTDGRLITEVPISPGQAVLIPIIAVHRMDHVWKDADEFRPERWLGDLPPREQLTSGWGNMLSFSDGPRHCPGIRLAVFEYKVVMTNIMKKFLIKDSGYNIQLGISSSLQSWAVGREEEGPWLPVRLELL
ncbi:cytochrome P450 [Cubamyces lactineus]|nr:cytochrome P450 [Cubamyces lactineus]